MSSTTLLVRRARLASFWLAYVVPMAAALAQTAPQPAPPPPNAPTERETGRRNQKIERIHVEDSGATVDELRVGGQTESITVKPKNNAPAYQVMPNEAERTRNQGQSDQSTGEGGSRVWWNIFKF
ncbi:MAG: hypothetical protein EOP82_28890 [Variovorax sp.]|nr:MAG: hypothetical protein EOP82_28890 [Variovorax sp.]